MIDTSDSFQKNDDTFQKLLTLGKFILDICGKLGITPIVYGSFACFYHTKNEEVSVNDLDFLLSECSFPELMRMFDQEDISYELKSWHSLVIMKNGLKIELDSMEHYLGERSREFSITRMEGIDFRILNLVSLADIYKEAIENMPSTPEYEKQKRLYIEKLNILRSM